MHLTTQYCYYGDDQWLQSRSVHSPASSSTETKTLTYRRHTWTVGLGNLWMYKTDEYIRYEHLGLENSSMFEATEQILHLHEIIHWIDATVNQHGQWHAHIWQWLFSMTSWMYSWPTLCHCYQVAAFLAHWTWRWGLWYWLTRLTNK